MGKIAMDPLRNSSDDMGLTMARTTLSSRLVAPLMVAPLKPCQEHATKVLEWDEMLPAIAQGAGVGGHRDSRIMVDVEVRFAV